MIAINAEPRTTIQVFCKSLTCALMSSTFKALFILSKIFLECGTQTLPITIKKIKKIKKYKVQNHKLLFNPHKFPQHVPCRNLLQNWLHILIHHLHLLLILLQLDRMRHMSFSISNLG